MKKLSLLLALLLCLGTVSPCAVSADEAVDADEAPKTYETTFEVLKEKPERTVGLDCYEVVENGSAELTENAGKKIYNWGWTSHVGRDNTYLGCGFVEHSTDAHSEEHSVRVYVKEGERCDIGPSVNIIAGQTYEASVWFKRLKEGGNARMELLFSGSIAGVAQNYTRVKVPLGSEVRDGWVQKTVRFVAPEHATSVWVNLRFDGPGDILWDDVSLLCITNEMPKPEMPDKLPAIQSMEIEDPGFESAKVGELIDSIEGWEAIGEAKVSDEYAHTGKQSIELRTEDGSKDAIGVRYLTGLEEGATYQVSSWLMNPSKLKIDLGYWMHWCSSDEYDNETTTQLGQEKPRWMVATSLQWQEYVAEFTVPRGAKSAMLYFRHRLCPGSIFMDDIEINMVKAPDAIKADTDEVFYYTEWESGKVSCLPKYLTDPENAHATFTFLGLNGETLDEKTFTNLSEAFDYEFPLSFLAKKGERYTINMKVYDAENTVIQEKDFPVYRYDRPTYLGADGIFRKNGKEVFFSMGSGLNMNVIDDHPEKSGITVAQLNADNPKLGFEQEERMDAYYKQGMFVIINLYSGVKSGGHPDMLAQTKRIVENLKDHPALFGWKLCDEPYQKGISDEEMIAGYKAIRDIDPNHPVYIDDSPIGSYDWLFKFCDIFECDYYGGGNTDGGRKMTEVMDQVQVASKGRKPYSVLLQFFQQQNYFPSVDDLRHMIYQSLFSGAYGYSYHTFGVDGTDGVTTKGIHLPEFQDLVEKWAPWEKDFAMGCFVTGKYGFVNYQKTNDVLWGTFTDGSDLYAIVLNRNKSTETTADIPLADGGGTVSVGAYTATRMTGEKETKTGNGTLSLALKPWEAVVWKVTPGEKVDFSQCKVTGFNDIIDYPWAYNAIAALEEKGIVNRVSNNWYGPGQNITRGDYAMFLVRALGLSDAAAENFADVPADAEYAKELAIGKAAGILQGVGDNKFNPEAQITRQDMMTMTSRAMKLAGSTDLSSFSDSGMIADYASSHVSAMVAEGLIKGNADGTINPLGNTTRAEAAVIMNRIMNK